MDAVEVFAVGAAGGLLGVCLEDARWFLLAGTAVLALARLQRRPPASPGVRAAREEEALEWAVVVEEADAVAPRPAPDPQPEEVKREGVTNAFEVRREAIRASSPVPGVHSEFDRRRQTLAEAALPELRRLLAKEFHDQPDALAFMTDPNCYRFLRARNGDARLAMDMIRSTLVWRRKHDIVGKRARCELCEKEPYAHAYFCMGHDIYDRAVMYSCSARAVSQTNAEASVFHIVSEMDHFLNDDTRCAQIVWVVDFSGFQARHSNPQLGKLAVHLFQLAYPERLGQLVLLDFPWLFQMFLKVVSPLIDPVTRAKILVLRTSQERQAYMDKHWTPEMTQWMNDIFALDPKPGKFPPSAAIRSRYW